MSFLTSILGFALYVLSFPMTILNENGAVQSYIAHGEGLGKVVELTTSTTSLITSSSSFQGQLVHFTSQHFRDIPTIKDPDFGITIQHGFALERRVEMLQWIEYDSQAKVATTEEEYEEATAGWNSKNSQSDKDDRYNYKLEWRSEAVGSNSYYDRTKHNPSFLLQSETFVPFTGLTLIPNYDPTSINSNNPVLEFHLDARVISNFIKPTTLYAINDDMLQMAGVAGSGASILSGASTKKIAGGKKMLRRSDYELHDGMLYTKGAVIQTQNDVSGGNGGNRGNGGNGGSSGSSGSGGSGGNGGSPGQVRISYRVATIDAGLSIMAGVSSEGKFVKYTLPSGKDIMMVRLGTLTATQMIRRADFENSLRMIVMRVFSFLLAFFGLLFLLQPAKELLEDVPLVGNVLRSALLVGLCRSAFIGAAMTTSMVVGALWVAVDLSVGGPALMFAPICMVIMRSWIQQSERYGKIQYQRVPGLDNVEEPVEFGLDEQYHD